MASSSASASYSSTDIPLREKYDVFLSFRGPDTRRSFTSHLKKALDDKKMDTFMDYDLERGEEIAPALLKAIERSVISVVIFSENYASSRWCLDELVHIMECKDKYGRHVIPVFYETDVSDIRHQRESYELEERFKDRTESERLKWKVALTKAANLSGYESKQTRDDSDLTQLVVQCILMKVGDESSGYELSGFVGVQSRVQELESLLFIVPQDDRVRVVGIWGMGGIGKTTLADVVYHRLSRQFDACCFLGNVREGSGTDKKLKGLRNKLFRTLLGDTSLDIQGESIDHNTARKLGRKKVLIVLDDVNDSRQLEILVGHHSVPFGPGSRIIITSRDKKQLDELMQGDSHDVVIYKVKKLNDVEAHQLLLLKAPTDRAIATDSDLRKVVKYAQGVPLALRTLCSLLHKGVLNRMEKISSEKLRSVYKVSYDVLTEDEKNIFLDIACFHKGKQIEDAKGLDGYDLSVSSGISALVEMSLIELRNNELWMHDMIQEMGREIVRQQCPEEAGKRSRLYTFEDVYHVLHNNRGSATVQAISTKESSSKFRFPELNLNPQVFREMYNLRFLDLYPPHIYRFENIFQLPQGLEFLPDSLKYLFWPFFPLRSLPSSIFSAYLLVELHMPYSELQTLGNKDQNLGHLKVIDLRYSSKLVEIPCLTKSKCLESIKLEGCGSLVQVPDLSQSLNIASINLEGCNKLVEVPAYIENLHKLTVLNLRSCRLLKCIPEMPGNMEFLLIGGGPGVNMELSGLPSSVWSLKKLVELDLKGCYHIKNLPSRIWTLNSLTSLDLSYTSLNDLPSSVECLSRVVSIDLQNCYKLVSLSDSIDKLKSLKTLNLSGCSSFVSLSTSIYKLKSLEVLDLSGCLSFKLFPEILEPMESLKSLRLSGAEIEELHESIENLVGLEELDLSSCRSLKSVSNSILKLRRLEKFRIAECCKLKKLPNSSSGILWSLLSVLDLGGCTSLEEFPDGIMVCLVSLKELNLNKTKIKSIPTSIKELSGLTSLYIRRCELLESLLELPYFLQVLDADSCRNLEMVSFSLTAFTQGLDQICDADVFTTSPRVREKYSFRNCKKLGETAKSNMMDDAQLRIMRMSAAFSRREQIDHYHIEDYSVAIVYSGNEIPEWFRYQAEGSLINIKLPVHPPQTNTNFWLLVLCAVLTFDEDKYESYYDQGNFISPSCNSNFTTNNGDCSEFEFMLPWSYASSGFCGNNRVEKSQVFVWNCAQWSTHVRNASEASFKFYSDGLFNRALVKRCGVCLLSSQSQEVKYQDLGVPKPEQYISTKRSRDQYEAS